MITEERVSHRTIRRPPPEPEVRAPQARPTTPPSGSEKPGIGWRIVLALAGFGLAVLGWSLIMTALLAFIGLPIFIFGLALMQAQES